MLFHGPKIPEFFSHICGSTCIHPPGGNPLVPISLPSPTLSSPPHTYPVGSILEKMLEVTLLTLLQNDFIFSGNCSRPELACTQLEFPNFLCTCLSLGISSLHPGASFLHLGFFGVTGVGVGAWLRLQKCSALALSVPGPTSLTCPPPLASPPSLSFPPPLPFLLFSQTMRNLCCPGWGLLCAEPCSRHSSSASARPWV